MSFTVEQDGVAQTFTFAAGQTQATFTFTAPDNGGQGTNGSTTVEIVDLVSYDVGTQHTASALLIDAWTPIQVVMQTVLPAMEGQEIQYTFTRDHTDGPLTIFWRLSPFGSATDGADFIYASDQNYGTLTFADGQDTGTITFDTIEDGAYEGLPPILAFQEYFPNETFSLEFVGGDGSNGWIGTIAEPNGNIATIMDRDPPPPPPAITTVGIAVLDPNAPHSEFGYELTEGEQLALTFYRWGGDISQALSVNFGFNGSDAGAPLVQGDFAVMVFADEQILDIPLNNDGGSLTFEAGLSTLTMLISIIDDGEAEQGFETLIVSTQPSDGDPLVPSYLPDIARGTVVVNIQDALIDA